MGQIACIYCGNAAKHPILPICLKCDLDRLKEGKTADDVRRDAESKGLDPSRPV
jgi:hypothetical protein